MGLKSSEKVETNVYSLEVEIDSESFENAINKAFIKNRNKISVPGFRKGKASRAMIEKMYGENVFYEDALELLYPKAIEDAIKEADLKLVDKPFELDFPKIDKDDGILMTFKATVKPEVKLGDYQKIKAEKKSDEVSEADVDEEVSKLAERNARMVSIEDKEKPVESGDTVSIDFKGFVDGEAFEGGEAEKYELKIGSNSFIPGFEDQIIGHKLEEEFDINVKFPDDYNSETLAGQDAVFSIKIHDIMVQELPEVDDEFAKDVSECETLEELKEQIKHDLEHKKEHEVEDDFENQIVEQLLDSFEAEIPPVMYENQIDANIEDSERYFSSQQINLEMYLQYMGMDMDSYRESLRDQSEKQVKVRLALEKLAELESLAPSEEELDEEYKTMAEKYKIDIDKVKKIVSDDSLSEDIAVRKAMEHLKANA